MACLVVVAWGSSGLSVDLKMELEPYQSVILKWSSFPGQNLKFPGGTSEEEMVGMIESMKRSLSKLQEIVVHGVENN